MHPTLRRAAEGRLGLFTIADARQAGYEHPEIRRLLTTGRWVRLRRGVYVTDEALADAERRGARHRLDCLAVLLHLRRPEAALSHVSAARSWGLPVRRDVPRLIRLTDPHRWRRGEGFHVTRAPLAAGEVATSGPFRLTAPTRTLVDCARDWDLDDAVVALDAALLAGRTTVHDLRRAVDAVRHWPGAPRATRAIGLADGRAESPLDTRGRLRIIGAGLPRPELQVEIRTADRLVAVVDAWFDEAAVAVEFDGRVKYTDPCRGRSPEQVLWEEKRREDTLRSLDIRVVRVTEDDLGSQWVHIEERLRALLATPWLENRRFTATPRDRGLLRAG